MSTLSEIVIASLEGSEIARIVNIACLALVVYEWLITLDQEIEYFWSGRWTISRILFFCNRYIPFVLVMLGLIEFSVINPADEFCVSAVRFSFFSSILTLGIIQAMLILRIWYLFPDNKFIQYGMVVLWTFSMMISLAYTGVAVTGLRLLNSGIFALDAVGCRVARPVKYWRIFMPSLGLHAILYLMTAIRALRNRRILNDAPVLKRLLKDGGLFFFVVFVSVGFTAVGSLLEGVPQINIPVIFSNYLLAVTSIAMSRIMFSIHSFASHLGTDPGWLLSNVELRRLDWRKGATEGEIIVDCASSSHEHEHADLEFNYDGALRSQSRLKISRVGLFHDDTMWS